MRENFPPEHDEEDEARSAIPYVILVKPKPRVWTVFVVFAIAAVLSLAVQVAVMVVLIVVDIFNHPADPQQRLQHLLNTEFAELLTTPVAFMLLVLPGQLVFGVAALGAALLSPEPTTRRLGLVRPSLPFWSYPIVLIGTLFPAIVGTALAAALELVLEADDYFEQVFSNVTPSMAVPVILVIAFAPGFMEELLFRGYIQRRLLQTWSPWLAILTASSLFGFIHVMPHNIIFAFIVGFWLGFVAWRSGSIWLSILGHAVINGSVSIWVIGVNLAGWPADPPLSIVLSVVAFVFLCFVISLWVLLRQRPLLDGSAPTNDGYAD